MKRFIITFLASIFYYWSAAQTVLFDDGWRFHRGDLPNAGQPAFDDAGWRKIDLPHDFSIEDLPGTNSPFNADAVNGVSIGFTTGGTGWYRKTFAVAAQQKDKKIFIRFDGVYMNAVVWLNGTQLGTHPYGYTSFVYDITDRIKAGANNVLAVQVKNEGATSRWYAGSGINRHVWLQFAGPVHVAQWGTGITASDISTSSAKVRIQTKLLNETAEHTQVTLITHIKNKAGVEVGKVKTMQTVSANSMHEFGQNITVRSPLLWSTASPSLYTAVTEIYTNGKLAERTETVFGIRSISFDARQGFLLNGKPLKLKGGCFHNDNGPLGASAYDRAEERRAELMKASGFNAVRTSHNPPAPAFLDACDRLGILVIDEAFDMWNIEKNPQDYHLYFNEWWKKDLENMLLRDRNHPSIIMWSIGNEIPAMDDSATITLAKTLAAFVHANEPTRPVTAGVNSISEKKDPFFAALDIAGYNYAKDVYEGDHKRKPERVIVCTESYPLQAFDYWMAVLDHPYIIGDFVWTGFDYIGEASIGWRGYPQEKNFYPWNLAFCGDIDICGWKRPQSYYRDALWMKDQLSLFVRPPQPSFELNPKIEPWSTWNWYDDVASWNWAGNEGKALEVNVYSSCDEVELFLNGRSLGKQATNRASRFTAKFNVPYEAGVLQAVSYSRNKKIKTAALQTAAAPQQISLSADRAQIKANGQDLSYITVELLDGKGNRNPNAEKDIHFTIQGQGTIVGVGNANPMSIESYGLPQRKTWQGRCMVIIKSGKKAENIILTASAGGLESKTMELIAK